MTRKARTVYRCKREGCVEELPEAAVRHGDGHCSRICAQLGAGTMTAAEAKLHDDRRQAGLAGSDAGWRITSSAKYQRAHGADS